jgi:hypothetical protein
MSLVEITWNPERRELRKFGVIALVVLTAASAILHFLVKATFPWSGLPFCAGLTIFVISLISAPTTRYIYLALTFAALPIGMVVSFLLLAVFYFAILTPVGLVFRLLNRDLLARRFESERESYWTRRTPAEKPERYLNQF